MEASCSGLDGVIILLLRWVKSDKSGMCLGLGDDGGGRWRLAVALQAVGQLLPLLVRYEVGEGGATAPPSVSLTSDRMQTWS